MVIDDTIVLLGQRKASVFGILGDALVFASEDGYICSTSKENYYC
jgi:hypothetical protein